MMTLASSSPALGTTFWQVMRFAGVGIAATLVHVVVALAAQRLLAFDPVIANGTGFVVAFGVSFIGHARFTFRVGPPTRTHMRRFLVLSLLSLVVSTLVTVIATHFGARFGTAMLCVALVVPAASYLGARFWAFATDPSDVRTPL